MGLFTGDLHQTKWCHIHDPGMLRILCGQRFQVFQQFLTIFLFCYIDEVYNNDTGQIPQTQLSCNLFCRFGIDLIIGLFSHLLRFIFAGIDIDDCHGFRGLNDQISAAFQPDSRIQCLIHPLFERI